MGKAEGKRITIREGNKNISTQGVSRAFFQVCYEVQNLRDSLQNLGKCNSNEKNKGDNKDVVFPWTKSFQLSYCWRKKLLILYFVKRKKA